MPEQIYVTHVCADAHRLEDGVSPVSRKCALGTTPKSSVRARSSLTAEPSLQSYTLISSFIAGKRYLWTLNYGGNFHNFHFSTHKTLKNVHTCTHIYMHVQKRIYTSRYTQLHTHKHMHAYKHTYASTHIHMKCLRV